MNAWKASLLRISRLVVIPFRKELNLLGIMLAILGALDLVTILFGGIDLSSREAVWGVTLFVLVTLRAAQAFSELDHDPAATEWILFPASPTEKYLAAQIRLGILYYGLAVVGAWVGTELMDWFQTMVNGGTLQRLGDARPFSFNVSLSSNHAFLGGRGAWFLWGMVCVGASAIFGRHAAWKLVLALLGAGLSWFAVMVIVHWLVFSDQMHLPMYDRDHVLRSLSFLMGNWETPALNALFNQWWFGALVPLFFIVYGWARLREFEALHAVQS